MSNPPEADPPIGPAPSPAAGGPGVLGRRWAGSAVARHRAEFAEPSIWIWRRIVGAAFAFIVVTVTWYLVKVPAGLVGDDALPTQTQVATAFNEVRAEGFGGATLSRHAGLSLLRLALGLGIGSLLGVGLGLVIGVAPLVRTVVDPVSSFFRMVPGLAVAPLALIWLGAGEGVMVFVVAFSVLWLAMGTVSDARMRAMRGEPVSLPAEVIGGMRSVLLTAWVTLLAIETVVASHGLGSMIWLAQGRSDVILVGVYVAGLLGFVLDTALRAAQYAVTVVAGR